MNTRPSPAQPQLAPPGAGLPRPELLVARLLFVVRRLSTSRRSAEAAIRAERAALLARAWRCDPTLAARPVLIARPRGLEDSSRYWSLFMTLDHLRIVNRATAATITELVAGRTPPGTASTAAVKPSPSVDAGVVAAFDQSCEDLLEAGRNACSLRTRLRFAHPWFGPLDAAGWFVLAGVHLGLHRGQLDLILAGLAREASP